MGGLAGAIDEWAEIEPGRWQRKEHPEDGVVTLREGLSFAGYWQKRLDDDAPPRRRVDRLTIIKRLDVLGLLGVAEKAIAAADPLTRWRWNTAVEGVYADDEDTRNLLKAIGANPDVVLAPFSEE